MRSIINTIIFLLSFLVTSYLKYIFIIFPIFIINFSTLVTFVLVFLSIMISSVIPFSYQIISAVFMIWGGLKIMEYSFALQVIYFVILVFWIISNLSLILSIRHK